MRLLAIALTLAVLPCCAACGKTEWGPPQQVRGQIAALWYEPAHVDLEGQMFPDGDGGMSWQYIPVSYPEKYGGSVIIDGKSYGLEHSTAREAYVAGFRRGDAVTCETRERFLVRDEDRTKVGVDVVRIWASQVEAGDR